MLCVWNRCRSSATERRWSTSSSRSSSSRQQLEDLDVDATSTSPAPALTARPGSARSPLFPILEYPVSLDAVLLSDSPPPAVPPPPDSFPATETLSPAATCCLAAIAKASTSTLRRRSRDAAADHADNGHGGDRLTSPSIAVADCRAAASLARDDPRPLSRSERRRRFSRAEAELTDVVTEQESLDVGPASAVDGRWDTATGNDRNDVCGTASAHT